MSIFSRRSRETSTPAAAPVTVNEPFNGSDQDLSEEIAGLTALNRTEPSVEKERRILYLRHLAGVRLLGQSHQAQYPATDFSLLPDLGDSLPEFEPSDLTPELVRAAIMRDGSIMVRGLIARDVALDFADKIESAFVARAQFEDEGIATPGTYEEFLAEPGFGGAIVRTWIRDAGGVLAADSPSLAFQMQEMFSCAGIPELASAYLGQPALFSADKSTLRKATPGTAGGWHQDGRFMGPTRALNLWLSLSRCGDLAPGLDYVPRRLNDLVATGTDEVLLDWMVSQTKAEEAAGDRGIVSPIFEPGDALFFDELNLHKTGSHPSMPNPRYAIENWFFATESFPDDYVPIMA